MGRRILKAVMHALGYHVERLKSQSFVHIRDYPVDPVSRWGYGLPPHLEIQASLARFRAQYALELRAAKAVQPVLAAIPLEDAGRSDQPFWHNSFFSCLDAVMLVAILLQREPNRYIEIGSGFSTRFARFAVRAGTLKTSITSIDPHPRAAIDAICDTVVRQPLETVDPAFWTTVKPGEIVFFDGSHRAFTNSDVVVFFLDVLPRLPAGVLVHIHDIHWPDDYPPVYHDRFYSEQYLLGVLLMQPQTLLRPLLPHYFVCQDPELQPLAREVVGHDRPFTYPGHQIPIPGTSFWGIVEHDRRVSERTSANEIP